VRFITARNFDKHLKRLPRFLRTRFIERKNLFLEDRRHPLLDDHALHEPWAGCRSFSVTGDVRVIYRMAADDLCQLLDIGTHHDLYGN